MKESKFIFFCYTLTYWMGFSSIFFCAMNVLSFYFILSLNLDTTRVK